MRAVLENDIIVHITERGDTEIGQIPKGVGLERLRWDGKKVVDLADLDQIWVEERNGVFILHAIEVPGTQKVSMTYADRKKLTRDADLIRLKSTNEIEADGREQELKSKISALTLDDMRVLLIHMAEKMGVINKAPTLDQERLNRIQSKIMG